jgi:predicted DCC family thiol-disulfide oxidoreductase YuxK
MYLVSLKNITVKLTMYYDANCPLCLAEIHLLKSHNKRGLLHFVSLQDLRPRDCDINCDLAMETIHARLGENTIIKGPEVFFEAYKRTDLRLINAIFSFAIFRFIYVKFYLNFAKYRHQISKTVGPLLLQAIKKRYPDAN